MAVARRASGGHRIRLTGRLVRRPARRAASTDAHGCGRNTAAPKCIAQRELRRGALMATTNLTAQTFSDAVGRDGITLVDWWAAWCGPCRRFAPVFEKASETHSDIVFAKVDTEAEPELSAAAH